MFNSDSFNPDEQKINGFLKALYISILFSIPSLVAKSIIRSKSYPNLSFAELREKTLNNLKSGIDKVNSYTDSDFIDNKIIFGDMKFDLYNLFHGPISDALYHTGQIVVFRRASGNPIPKGVNHFMGIKM